MTVPRRSLSLLAAWLAALSMPGPLVHFPEKERDMIPTLLIVLAGLLLAAVVAAVRRSAAGAFAVLAAGNVALAILSGLTGHWLLLSLHCVVLAFSLVMLAVAVGVQESES